MCCRHHHLFHIFLTMSPVDSTTCRQWLDRTGPSSHLLHMLIILFFFYTQTQFVLVQCVSKSGSKPFTGCFLISQSLQPPLNKNSEQRWENQVRVLSLSFLICSTQQETTGNVLFVSRKAAAWVDT